MLEFPCVNADNGPAGDVLATDLGTARGNMSFKKQSDAGVEAHGFFDDGVEIWKMRDGFLIADRIAQLPALISFVDLGSLPGVSLPHIIQSPKRYTCGDRRTRDLPKPRTEFISKQTKKYSNKENRCEVRY